MTCTLAHSLNPGCNAQYLWPHASTLFLVAIVGAVLGLLLVAGVEWVWGKYVARRTDALMRRGMRVARGLGWIEESNNECKGESK